MTHVCEDCGKILKTAGALVYHKNRKNSCKKVYTCLKCDKIFNVGFHLKAHMLTCSKNINEQGSENINYKKILNIVPDMIMHYDLSGVIKYVSGGCKELLGYEPSEMLGKNGYDYLYSEDVEEVLKDQMKMMREKRANHIFITRKVCKDGTIKKININTNVLFDDDKKNVIGVITTERGL